MHNRAGQGEAGIKDASMIRSDAMQQYGLARVYAESMSMRVLIVDDHPIVASGCRALLAGDPEIVILEASDAESGERVFVAEHPDVCVLDINLPTVSGFELARRILVRAAAARL